MDYEKCKIFCVDLLCDSKISCFDYFDLVYGQVVLLIWVVVGDSDQIDKLCSDLLYFQDLIYLDECWILVGGVCYQIYDQFVGCGWLFNVNIDINGQKWVLCGGLVYCLSDEVLLYGSYMCLFKLNLIIVLLSIGEIIDLVILLEEVIFWELGVKLDVLGCFSGILVLFDICKKNVLVNEFDGVGNSSVCVVGWVCLCGLELDFIGQFSECWSLIGSYVWFVVEVIEDLILEGKCLQNVVCNIVLLLVVYEFGQFFGGDCLCLGGGVCYVGKCLGDLVNFFDLLFYIVVDVFVSYDICFGGYGVKFQFNVKNLFDCIYYLFSVN